MSTFVAFCENASCGAIFPVTNIIGGSGTVAKIEMTGCRSGSCPSCGSWGQIPDGVYTYSNNVVQFLTGPQESLTALRKIEALLRSFRNQPLTRDEVLNQVRAIAPQVAGVMETAPTVGVTQQWIQILIAFVTLAIAIQTTYFKADSDKIEKKFIEHLLQENRELQSSKQGVLNSQPYRRSTPKISKNSKCTCGSGKKYKRCCGA
ncbi:YecA family protein [Methylomonas rosea]|uniref:SEC-C metal-binding domain-containing protein n=1 Tax=Methylomonas rosea TaxID=2952227 RepID=A0ABT1TPB1_9GAMM|nr:SEC-C metal-binding domain-containing protein [Methylomonas sp. WSC-7]MCQ8116621.1 SEC-C metal-binding domain-containing protein [Methylomonas sp. WSC-7]